MAETATEPSYDKLLAKAIVTAQSDRDRGRAWFAVKLLGLGWNSDVYAEASSPAPSTPWSSRPASGDLAPLRGELAEALCDAAHEYNP